MSRYSANFVLLRRFISSNKADEYRVILDVTQNATSKEVKESFLRLSKVYHPDNRLTGSHDKFLKLKEAYDVLKDNPGISSGPKQRHRTPWQEPKTDYWHGDMYTADPWKDINFSRVDNYVKSKILILTFVIPLLAILWSMFVLCMISARKKYLIKRYGRFHDIK